jgi:heme exporter protein B
LLEISKILALVKKDFLLDYRQKFALAGILLYAFCTVFMVAYALQNVIMPMLWMSLYWIILFFGAINAIAKAFVQEHSNRNLYYYTLASPENIIIAKMLYNCVLISLLSIITIFIFKLFLPSPAINFTIFGVSIFLGANALSVLLTLISAIAAQTKNSALIMAILGVPLLLPLMNILQKLSTYAINYAGSIFAIHEWYILIGLILMISALSYILYPFITKD